MRKTDDIENIETLFENSPVWESLNESQRIMLERIQRVQKFAKGQIIHDDGATPEYAMVLLKGKVKISKQGNSQRMQILRMLKPGALFAYRAIIAGDRYSACATAHEACTVLCIPGDFFISLLRDNSRFCFIILKQMASDLDEAEVKTMSLTQKHVRGRLAESILSLKDQYGFDEDQCTIAMYMSREDLANMSNMITANAIRTLSDFAKEGLVGVDGRKIKILNEEELRNISRHG